MDRRSLNLRPELGHSYFVLWGIIALSKVRSGQVWGHTPEQRVDAVEKPFKLRYRQQEENRGSIGVHQWVSDVLVIDRVEPSISFLNIVKKSQVEKSMLNL